MKKAQLFIKTKFNVKSWLQLTIVSVAFLLASSTTAWSIELDYINGYFRAGIGSNSKGGDQECFQNPGAPAKFRLGNECDSYTEFSLGATHLKAKKEGDPYFRSEIMLAYDVSGNDGFEDIDTNIPQAYVEAGNVLGKGVKYWIGKRYYQRHDIYILDFKYLNTSGNGAGVENIDLGFAKLHIANIVRTDPKKVSDAGKHQFNLIDVRLANIAPFKNADFTLWLGLARSPSGEATDSRGATTKYKAASGTGYGLIWWQGGIPGGGNKFSIQSGSGLMKNLDIYGNIAPTDVSSKGTKSELETQKDASIMRVTDWVVFQPNNMFSVMLAGMTQTVDNGADSDSKTTWTAFGARPVIYFTDHLNVAFEVGTDTIDQESERDIKGDRVGSRSLTKFTIAPQITMGREFWSKPDLRVYYTSANWSKENEGRIGGAAYEEDTAGSAYGFQTEIWW